eukprot:Gregarina_sp_Poly_1__2541@NODE_168_length_12074_cov_98_169901_g149_i0_p3_GENE_NODE_168_length_12074_cov_98_169901_g149_i0NODE_168_length_12074_cov_98_169901_g149_i0_p3_ORF_typecomplete_len358_score44_42TERT_thumb/PF17984_1/0_13_NODE_168_length_12074_cov_98_169901_g149_i0301103
MARNIVVETAPSFSPTFVVVLCLCCVCSIGGSPCTILEEKTSPADQPHLHDWKDLLHRFNSSDKAVLCDIASQLVGSPEQIVSHCKLILEVLAESFPAEKQLASNLGENQCLDWLPLIIPMFTGNKGHAAPTSETSMPTENAPLQVEDVWKIFLNRLEEMQCEGKVQQPGNSEEEKSLKETDCQKVLETVVAIDELVDEECPVEIGLVSVGMCLGGLFLNDCKNTSWATFQTRLDEVCADTMTVFKLATFLNDMRNDHWIPAEYVHMIIDTPFKGLRSCLRFHEFFGEVFGIILKFISLFKRVIVIVLKETAALRSRALRFMLQPFMPIWRVLCDHALQLVAVMKRHGLLGWDQTPI